jgi:hypothetical protein
MRAFRRVSNPGVPHSGLATQVRPDDDLMDARTMSGHGLHGVRSAGRQGHGEDEGGCTSGHGLAPLASDEARLD